MIQIEPSADDRKLALSVRELRKDYVLKGETVHALRGVTFEVNSGDYMAVMGPSGSGKSTLLNLLGCLDRPTAGEYYLGPQNVADLDDDELSEVRASSIGFVFQSYNLIPQLTVIENIEHECFNEGCNKKLSHTEVVKHKEELCEFRTL